VTPRLGTGKSIIFFYSIDEGRAAIESSHLKFGYFLSIFPSKQFLPISFKIQLQNSAVVNLFPKTEGTKTKAARCRYVGYHTNLKA
jgi:hypothetical protein